MVIYATSCKHKMFYDSKILKTFHEPYQPDMGPKRQGKKGVYSIRLAHDCKEYPITQKGEEIDAVFTHYYRIRRFSMHPSILHHLP